MANVKIPSRFKVGSILPKGNNILPAAFLILCGFSGFGMLLNLGLMAQVAQIAAKNNTTFVQLADGNTYYIGEREEKFRHPQTLKRSVEVWLNESFQWRGKSSDEPKMVGDSLFVTPRAYFASFLLESKLRTPVLEEIAKVTPRGVFDGDYISTIAVSDISEPKEIGLGKWELNVVATRIVVPKNGVTGKETLFPFNRTFKLQSVPIPKIVPPASASELEKKVYEYRSSGLEIYDIMPFEPR